MAAIAVGVVGALIAARLPPLARWQTGLMLALGAMGMLVEMFAGRWLWPLLGDKILLLMTVAVMLMLVAFQRRPMRPVTGSGWLASWGRLSYEIYLTHMFVVYAAVALFRSTAIGMRWGFFCYLLALPLCWALGWLVARGFSQPCERWLRKRWSAGRAAAAMS